MAKTHGLAEPEFEAARPVPSNALAWRCWSLCFPDCRKLGINGAGFWDWGEVREVLEAYGIPLGPTLHRKMRVAVFEALKIESEQKKEKKSGK